MIWVFSIFRRTHVLTDVFLDKKTTTIDIKQKVDSLSIAGDVGLNGQKNKLTGQQSRGSKNGQDELLGEFHNCLCKIMQIMYCSIQKK